MIFLPCIMHQKISIEKRLRFHVSTKRIYYWVLSFVMWFHWHSNKRHFYHLFSAYWEWLNSMPLLLLVLLKFYRLFFDWFVGNVVCIITGSGITDEYQMRMMHPHPLDSKINSLNLSILSAFNFQSSIISARGFLCTDFTQLYINERTSYYCDKVRAMEMKKIVWSSVTEPSLKIENGKEE